MVMLHARTLRPEPRAVIDLWSLPELKGIRRVDDMLEIGAAESYTGIIRSALAQQHVPALVAAARTIGAAQIQNRGTLGGNLANASPAGDTLPVLLAYDAVVVTDRRSIPIDGFFTGYRKTALQADELITAVRLPLGRQVVFHKVGTRAAQAISKVVMAVCREPARVAIGSVAEIPLRATRAEAALANGDAAGAVAAVAEDIRPIDDVRSTAVYRRAVTQNVLAELLDAFARG
jgi:CO/xanthine dehydrogenase FAD-binding subunit